MDTRKIWNENPYLKAVLKIMCYVVDVDFYSVDFFDDKNAYWRKYSWTKEQKDFFIEWLTNFLYEDAKARKELMTWHRKSKKYCRKAAEEFCWQYGWVLKD